jgi:hypothetical protein
MNHPFSVGQRIQLNHHGRIRMPRVRSHVGTVIKVWAHSETIQVLLDGQVTPLSLHHRYIENARKVRSPRVIQRRSDSP